MECLAEAVPSERLRDSIKRRHLCTWDHPPIDYGVMLVVITDVFLIPEDVPPG